MSKLHNQIKTVRESLRLFNRRAGVLKSDPYELGLSLSQCSALVDIGRFKSLRSKDLVKILNLEKSSVSRLISVLIEQKLIRMEVDAVDGRVKKLVLTTKGWDAVKKINRISNKYVEDIFANLGTKDIHLVSKAFQRIGEVVRELDTKSTVDNDKETNPGVTSIQTLGYL